MSQRGKFFVLTISVFLIVLFGSLLVPPIRQRVVWQLNTWRTEIFYRLNPPDQVSFVPTALPEETHSQPVSTFTALPSSTFTPTPTEPEISPTPSISPTPAPTATALPSSVRLSGIRHEYQSFNNCGPATLSMQLSYWGWSGDQRDTKAWLRPNEDDSNVMPEELAAFIQENTGLSVIVRTGGSNQVIKELTAAGFPVMIEIGHHPPKDWWMGHYVLVSGYDDAYGVFITQDSLIMPDLPLPYEEVESHWWRDFNYTYIVVYSPELETQIRQIIGDNWEITTNLTQTFHKAEVEIPHLAGRDLFFALFNKASTLVKLENYQEASLVFDEAFRVYDQINEDDRPWRVFWYRTEMYQAYYYVGRYQDVINTANAVLSMLSKRGLEESHYWRGLSYEALGNLEQAIFDYEIAIQLRPSYLKAQQALSRLKP